MRDKLQVLVKQWRQALNTCCENYEGKMLEACTEDFEATIAARPPVFTLKAGWITKDADGVSWFSRKPYFKNECEWWNNNGGIFQRLDGAIEDPWADSHPNGGIECIMEVR